MNVAEFVIVCLIFTTIAIPINKQIEKRITNKVLSYFIQFLADTAILLCLYGLAALLGFNIND